MGKSLNIESGDKDDDPSGSNVADLMVALKNSLGWSGGMSSKTAAEKTTKTATKPAAKKTDTEPKPTARRQGWPVANILDPASSLVDDDAAFRRGATAL